MRLPNNTKALVFSRDSQRYDASRKLAWECYGRFGRRIALFSKDDCGTFWSREVMECHQANGGWVRLVTYQA
jgi:hypothetical protein